MLVAATVLPHPPALVPEVAVRSPQWLTELRGICLSSVRDAVDEGCDRVVVVGPGARDRVADERAAGAMTAYGVPVRFGGAAAGAPHGPALPLALTLGAYLLDAVGWSGERRYVELDPAGKVEDRRRAGGRLAHEPGRTVLLAMGDGSAKRTATAPGYLDERAEGFDATVAGALATPAADTLLELDPRLADELWVAGLPAWQVLAGAIQSQPLDAIVRYDEAPSGVGYFVVDLRPGPTA